MSQNHYRNEKDEKQDEKDEKDVSKHEEKTVEEKWRRDPLGTVTWALVLIWAGIVLLVASNSNLIQSIPSISAFGGLDWFQSTWSIILVGAGVLFLIEAVIRLIVPAYRRPVWGTIFFGIILIAFGLGNIFDWRIVFALLLVFLGLSLVFRRREEREEDKPSTPKD
jgi:hypothetical protein